MNSRRKKAVALTYDNMQNPAPKISATGQGRTAENIIKIAQENQVPIIEDPSLVELLIELNINETIPKDLYEVVAEVFAYIYKIDQNKGGLS